MTVAAFAQGGPPGGGRGQGGMRMMGGGNSILGLLGRTDVQTDIGATAEQKSAIQALQTKQREAMQAMFEEMRGGGGGGNPEEMRTKMQESQAKWDKEALALITPEQATRVKQIRIQLAGNAAILDKEVQKSLNMTESQLGAIKTAQNKQQADQQDLMEQMRNGEIDRTEMQPAMQKINETFNKALGEILSQEQKDALIALGGKKFTPTQQGRGGGGL